MAITVSAHDLGDRAAEVLRKVREGGSVAITEDGTPIAIIAPAQSTGKPMARVDLLALLDRSRKDPTFAADVAVLTE